MLAKIRFQSILSQFELSVVNKEPFRVTKTSATIIDLVITNRPRWAINSRVLDIGISDHKLVASNLSLKVTRPKIMEIRNRLKKKNSEATCRKRTTLTGHGVNYC